jgi:hypothetical protein
VTADEASNLEAAQCYTYGTSEVGLYKLSAVDPQRPKAPPGFNPCTSEVENSFQAIAFKWNSYRCTEGLFAGAGMHATWAGLRGTPLPGVEFVIYACLTICPPKHAFCRQQTVTISFAYRPCNQSDTRE